MNRPPVEIMADFDKAIKGQADVDPYEVLAEILEDVLNSITLAESQIGPPIHDTVRDYITNHYF